MDPRQAAWDGFWLRLRPYWKTAHGAANGRFAAFAFALLWPAALLVPAYFVVPRVAALPDSLLGVVRYGPYLIFAGGLALAWGFHRCRAFYATVVLLLGHWTVVHFLSRGVPEGVDSQALYDLVCVLLPLNLAGFALLTEHGIFTLRGRVRFDYLLVQIVLVVWLMWVYQGQLDTWLGRELVRGASAEWTPIPQFGLVAFTLAGTALLTRFYLTRSPLDSAFFGALLAGAAALHAGGSLAAAAVFLSVAALIVMIGVLQVFYTLAYVDELTGLPGRRALMENLARLGPHYTIAMLDVDRFKLFNDTYGHDAGDEALRFVAAELKRRCDGGRAFRYGGEEFALVFPNAALETVLAGLDGLRLAIGRSAFTLRTGERRGQYAPGAATGGAPRASVTVSIGAAEPGSGRRTPHAVLKAADEALYRAKRAGRNRLAH